MILISCTKHPGYIGDIHPATGSIHSTEPCCLACSYVYIARQQAEKRIPLGVKVGEAGEAWKVEDAIKGAD